MNATVLTRAAAAGLLTLALCALGCDQDETVKKAEAPAPAAKAPAPQQDVPKKTAVKEEPPAKKSQLGKNVFLETQGDRRRVLVNAFVCARKLDQLEQLLCRKFTKEHEAILAAEVDARHIHLALIAAKAEPGSPVQFQPKYKPASGTKIKVLIQYTQNGKTVTVPAQQWVRHIKTKKDLQYDWVFAGSRLFPNPEPDQPPHYAANSGDVICVSNFDTAMLDLPVNSPSDNEALTFEAHTERIPEVNTPVTVILEPMPAPKK